jgi:hypothetical protein
LLVLCSNPKLEDRQCFGHPQLLTAYIRRHPPYQMHPDPVRNPMTRLAVVTRDTLIAVSFEYSRLHYCYSFWLNPSCTDAIIICCSVVNPQITSALMYYLADNAKSEDPFCAASSIFLFCLRLNSRYIVHRFALRHPHSTRPYRRAM